MIPLSDQIRCIQREVKMRQRVYPALVARGTMTQANADHELACMQAVLASLELLDRPAQALLFDETMDAAMAAQHDELQKIIPMLKGEK